MSSQPEGNLYDEYLSQSVMDAPKPLRLNAKQKDFMRSTLKMRQHRAPTAKDSASGEFKSGESAEAAATIDLELELEAMANPM